MAQKPSIPKGTRDFTPIEAARRNYIFDTIRSVFTQFGYAPIETPAMEQLSTLLGKYGQEGDKLLFKVLNSGDCFAPLAASAQLPGPKDPCDSNAIAMRVCEKGLRYDLTVPFARFVVQHQSELVFPFKRYQIQPVWRADRPQKGRYREFYQCDVDVIGSTSLYNEVELIQMVDAIFLKLGIHVDIKINNRKVLAGIAEIMGCPEHMVDITVAIDKLDKIGFQAVLDELSDKGISHESIAQLTPLLLFEGNAIEKIDFLRSLFAPSKNKKSTEVGMKGLEELNTLCELLMQVPISQTLDLDLSLARGLNYYTGAIIEVKAHDFEIGSICGGGRYDNLTGIFGLPNMSGVGISFGADRIYDVLLGLNKFPDNVLNNLTMVFFNLGQDEAARAMQLMRTLHQSGVSCELYPEAVKLKKQFDYAQRRGAMYVAILGESELANHQVTVKELATGNQETLEESDFYNKFGK